MLLRYCSFGFFLAIAFPLLAQDVQRPPALSPVAAQAEAANLSAQLLSRYAYRPAPIDDALSMRIMDRYLKSLDPDRSIFLQADIDGFAAYATRIDDAIIAGSLDIPFSIFAVYAQRIVDRVTYARSLVKQGFDFGAQEDYLIKRDGAPWPKSQTEANELWRKRVKNDWLRLKLAGQGEGLIRATLDKRYENLSTRVYRYKSDDVFQSFMAAFTTSIDPHTDYFGAAASADFDISMKLSLVGIGAVLQERDGYTTIRELVSGGPASLSGMLSVGDRIIAVGEGRTGPLTDVVGTRLDEVVQRIRGKKDTTVRLDVLPADGTGDATHRVITLVRDKISLEKQAARKTILSLGDRDIARKIGVITLPAFYEDFEARRQGDKGFRSASRDVAGLIDELKRASVDGIVIDLRDNGGGSLAEAIDLTGLFVGNGPVVQQQDATGRVEIESDDRSRPAWTGPVGVLINRGSASASEIFAAAIQDHGRGVIVGEASFGKGTVQTVIDLDQAARNSEPRFGQLKLTIAQFFRIDGGTTQLRGVTPDITLPGLLDPATVGESSYENALPWTKIKPAPFRRFIDMAPLIPQLQARHLERVGNDTDFQRFVEDAKDLTAQRNDQVISLNETVRREELTRLAKRLRERGATGATVVAGADDGFQSNERSLSEQIAIEDARAKAKDVLKNEAAAIVADLADLSPLKPAR